MEKIYTSLGLMSGTSMDGVDVSIVQSDGKSKYKTILDKYFEYPENIYQKLNVLRDKIKNQKDLKKYQKKIQSIEKQITVFHAVSVKKILKKSKVNIDFIGFHGQTIFHNAKEKISKQLGDGKLLSKLLKKTVIYNFRQNDLKNNGEGAPLVPIFHQLLKKKFKIKKPRFINIGGIINITYFDKQQNLIAYDLGPGMCLIDKWIREKSKKRYDKNGEIAQHGTIDKKLLEKLLIDQNKILIKKNKLQNKNKGISYDVKDFDLSVCNGKSFKSVAATLTELINKIIFPELKMSELYNENIILCGGGRKNKFLIRKLQKSSKKIKLIDEYGIDGDFVESQAFGYLAIRSYLKLPISFPKTTGCNSPSTGGVMVNSF